MAFKFENLLAWQKVMDLNDKIHHLSKDCFPKDELYILSSQIRRASDSIVLNIAEGCTGQSKASFKAFLNYSLRSAIEVVSCLFIAKRRKYINEETFQICIRNLKLFAKLSQA
ncbi:MAG: four helix bundle protein [Sphingobacteriaceae bacterium]